MEKDDAGKGATWPDVALAVLDFAREDPVVFCSILFFVALVVWALLPRAGRALHGKYEKIREDQRKQSKAQLPDRQSDKTEDKDG